MPSAYGAVVQVHHYLFIRGFWTTPSLDFEDDLIDRAGVCVAIRHGDFQDVLSRCERLQSNACAVRNAGQIGTGVDGNRHHRTRDDTLSADAQDFNLRFEFRCAWSRSCVINDREEGHLRLARKAMVHTELNLLAFLLLT